MNRYGLIGFPVKHSFSAAMHNAAFASLGLAATYELFEVAPEALGDFLRAAPAKGLQGLNVTIPHKENALKFLDERSSEVDETGAVNTIRITDDGRLCGINTDYTGFSRHIKELPVRISRAAVLGAGGAAKAVTTALARCGSTEIVVFDVDEQKRLALTDTINRTFQHCTAYAVDSVAALELKEKTILINATPVGMHPADSCLVSEDMVSDKLFVYDLIYNPAQTKLLQLAAGRGLSHTNGLPLLLYQGAAALSYWLNQAAPETVMREALEGELEKCRNNSSPE